MGNIYRYDDGLETDRILTRKLVFEDHKIWTEFFESKAAIEFFRLSDFVSYEQWAKEWIARQLKRYTDSRYGMQAILNKQTDEFIGQCGILTQEVDGVTELEVGYHILPRYWGQGYAPEAARLFIDYAFENALTPSIISIIHPQNVRSQRVAEKNELALDKKVQWNGIEVCIYRITKAAWLKNNI